MQTPHQTHGILSNHQKSQPRILQVISVTNVKEDELINI